MVPSTDIKKEAKIFLKSNYISAIFVTTIFIFSFAVVFICLDLFAMVFGPYISFVLFCAILFFIVSPLYMGFLKYFWVLSEGTNKGEICVFWYFSSFKTYFKPIKLFLTIAVKVLPLGLAFHLPALAVWIFSKSFTFELFDIAVPLWASNLQSIVDFLFFLAQIATLIYSSRFYIAPVLLIADSNMDLFEAINMSEVIAKKNSVDFLSLIFTLSGWIAACFLVMPLPFILPYLIMCYVVHFRFAVLEYNNYVEQSIEREFPTFTAGAFYEE